MTAPEDWPRVKLVLEGALARDAASRDAYLRDACGADRALRARVETLLAAGEDAGTFLETPAAVLLQIDRPREDLSGRAIASYRLVSLLGSGGMGEVYLARDTKLDRPVAIKFLSPELSVEGDRLRRFHREAQAASSLNHPHIVVVHDFGEMDGRPYIVTEFVEGDTLRRHLADGPLPAREAIDLSMQIAGALAAAHARGLVHRDIKPDNIMVRPDGYVKVLDFGLAKLAPPDSAQAGHGRDSRTHAGVVMGTPRYMSPEQARGLDVDARSDVWSLGVVLYEMVAGRPPYEGATPADAIAAMLATDPVPLDARAPHAPPALTAIVHRATRRDRAERYANAGEMLDDLRRLAAQLAGPAAGTATPGATDEDADEMLPGAGERRRAVVLVTVVSEYASLVERLAAPALDAAIARIRAAAVDAMRRHGGIVNQSIGEEIVALFGIPAAHEDDDLRAVRAAAELHARAREIGRTLGDAPGVHLELQSGLHAGSMVVQRLREGPRRYAVTGAPVQTAARLAAAAQPGALLISPECQRRVAPFVRTAPSAAVSVRPDAPPIAPHAVIGESGLDNRLESPDRGGLTPYSGRTDELRTLQARVERARHGEGGLVLVVGEAGAGKSRLLHELRAHASSSDLRVVQGRCRAYGGITSYLPFVEALHGALGLKDLGDAAPGVDAVVARVRAIEASLEPFIPLYLHLLSLQSDALPVPRHLRGEHLQAAMLDALAAFFTSQAQRAPVLLLLEDWHWADDASRLALLHLREVVAACPLLLIVTTRPDSAGWREAADQALRIDLGPLDYASSLAIMKSVLGVARVPDDLAQRLHERTGGNPFFLEEMCRGLDEAGLVTARGAEAVAAESAETLQLPDSVQAVIRSRLDRLNAEGRELLRVASVIGREFPRRILCDAMGAGDLAGTIERVKHAGIIQQIRVVPDPVYRFRHVLTQEVTYESLLEHQRKALHEAVGRAMERNPPGSFEQPLELLAHHFSRAELWDEAIDYGLRAASRATELSQFADALSTLERVQDWLLRLPDDPARRDRIADVLLKQERLCETLGMRGRQLQLSGELIALLAPHGASVRLAEAYLRQGDVSTLLKRFDAADRALATSLRMSRERGDAALERNALRSIGLLRWHEGRHAEALSITETALAIDRQRADDLAVVGDLSNLGNILRSLGDYPRALTTLEEALTLAGIAGDPIKRAYILHNIGQVHRALGDVGRALECLQEADESARVHRLPIQRSFHLTSIAHIHLQEGRVDESLRMYREAVDLSRRARHADGLAQSLRMLGEILFGIGHDEEALGHLQEASQLFAQIEDRAAEIVMRRHTAVILERQGRPEAMAAWEQVRTLALSVGDVQSELDGLEGIARAERRGTPAGDAALRRFEEALALASRLGQSGREAALRNTLGILHWERGACEEALAHYEAALRLVRDAGDRVHEGLTLNSIGATLTRLRRYEEARTALEEALAVNRETGERRLEAHGLAALGAVAATLGRLDAAVRYFEDSLSIRRETEDPVGEAWMHLRLAGLEARLGRGADARERAATAARIAAECGDISLRRACETHLADVSGGDSPPRQE